MDDVWLSTQEAADLADVSRPFIAKMCDQRKLTFRQIGNRRRVLESSLRNCSLPPRSHRGQENIHHSSPTNCHMMNPPTTNTPTATMPKMIPRRR